MIHNIVFDLGNVLISFKPAEYLEKKKYPAKTRDIILTDLFGSKEWLLLDNGEITVDEAIDLISKGSSLKREEIAFFFNKRTDIMFPLENNVRLLPWLKKKGFKLYYLSNFPADIFAEIKIGYPFFKYFDGGIISAEVNYSKPDPEIFRMFLEKYNLTAGECLYIDDIKKNVMSAELIGMKGIHCNNSDSLTEDLFFQFELQPFLKDGLE